MVFVLYISAIAVLLSLLSLLGLSIFSVIFLRRIQKFLENQVLAYQTHTDFMRCMVCGNTVAKYFRDSKTKKITCANCDHKGWQKSQDIIGK